MIMRALAILFYLLFLSSIVSAQQVRDTVLVHRFIKPEPSSNIPQAMVFWFSSVSEAKIIRMGEGLFTKKACIIKDNGLRVVEPQYFTNVYISKSDFDSFNEFFTNIIHDKYLIIEQDLPKVTCSVFNYPDKFIREGDWGGYKSFQFYNDTAFVYYEFNRTTSYLYFLNECLNALHSAEVNNDSASLLVAIIEKQILALKAAHHD